MAWVRQRGDSWLKCDDDQVSPVTSDEILKLSGGGKHPLSQCVIQPTELAGKWSQSSGSHKNMLRRGAGGEPQSVTGLHGGPGPRTLTGSGEDRGTVGGWPADWAHHPRRCGGRPLVQEV